MIRPIRILLVEDNPGDARLLVEHLRGAPSLRVEVEHETRLDRARERLAREQPDIILLDLSLPDAQGMETVRGALEAAPDVPIVVLTGLDDDAVALRALNAGAQDYLVKGQVEAPLLARSIRYAIERKQLERDRHELLAQEQEARTRAEAAVRTRDQVLQILSHDIGNQLAAIQLYARMLVSAVPDAPEWEKPRSWADGIQELTEDLQALRANILDSTQIESGRLSLDRRPLDACELLESVRDRLLPLAEEKGVALGVSCGSDVPAVAGDRQRMLQALGNIVGNAIKFTPAGRGISLRVHGEPGQVCISVADEGPGIAPEDVPRIFESFWKTAKGNPTGVGLGLGIARGIVEMHGGTLRVESELGRGTVFSLVLPADEAPERTS